MQVWEGLESVRPPFEQTSVAIGVFDGVHLGHQALIQMAVEDARRAGRQSVIFTFDRHPAELVAPDKAPGYLSTPQQRIERIARLNPDHLVIARFDERFRDLSPECFLAFVLHGVLGSRAVLVGEDFRFGVHQSGSVADLEESQERFGYELTVLEPVLVGDERASSTRVRQLVRAGDVEEAATMLGAPYLLEGVVVRGEQLGRTLGYPTANLQCSVPMVLPADGIYAVRVHRDSSVYLGACSIGMRPTVGGTHRTIEIFLLDFSGDLYGETIGLEFVRYLRPELKFESLDALVEQMGRDVLEARGVLGGLRE